MYKRKGFTLAELIVTLGVLTIVLGVIFFTVSRRDSSYRDIMAASNLLMSEIRYTRQRAIFEGERVAISFDGANGRYTIHYSAPFRIIREGYLPEGITFAHGNIRAVHFRPRGTPSSGFSVTIRSTNHRLTLSVVGSGGRVRISNFWEVD